MLRANVAERFPGSRGVSRQLVRILCLGWLRRRKDTHAYAQKHPLPWPQGYQVVLAMMLLKVCAFALCLAEAGWPFNSLGTFLVGCCPGGLLVARKKMVQGGPGGAGKGEHGSPRLVTSGKTGGKVCRNGNITSFLAPKSKQAQK